MLSGGHLLRQRTDGRHFGSAENILPRAKGAPPWRRGFFADASNEELLCAKGASGYLNIQTNAPVIVKNTAEITVEASIDQWVDFQWFVHTADVLRRQAAFNNWVKKMTPALSNDISYVPMTGILDRSTLWASYRQMQYRLEYAQRGLRKLCSAASDGKDSCAGPPWPNGETQLIADAIGPASQAAANYKSELATVAFTRPTPYNGMCDDVSSKSLIFSLPIDYERFGGSDDYLAFQEVSKGKRASVCFGAGGEYRERNNRMTESVDLAAMNAGKLSRLASLEREAQRRIQYLSDLSGDPD